MLDRCVMIDKQVIAGGVSADWHLRKGQTASSRDYVVALSLSDDPLKLHAFNRFLIW